MAPDLKLKLFTSLIIFLSMDTQAAIYFCSAERSSSMGYNTEINQVESQTNFMIDTTNGYSTIGSRMVEQTISYVGSCKTSNLTVFCRDGSFEKGDLNQSTIHISMKNKLFLYVNHNAIVPLVTTVTGQCNSIAEI